MQQSQSSKRRNIFRASLRRQFIQSYQHTIRMKYLALEQQDGKESHHTNLKLTVDSMVRDLDGMLKLGCQELCTIGNFEYFVSCIETVFQRKADTGDGAVFKEFLRELGRERDRDFYEEKDEIYDGRGSERNWLQTNRNARNSENRGSKISGVWIHRQKVYSLLYRILQKVFNSATVRIWYIIDKALYMLQFPQLMPLWEKLSGTGDQKSKNYCSRQFSKKLTKPSYSSISQSNIILDQDFVLDILTNFIVQAPCISFENALQLMPFINYCLNIGYSSQKQQVPEVQQQSYPRLNKVCIILRSVLKEDSKGRMVKLVENGFEQMLIFLIDETYHLFQSQRKNMNYEDFMEDEDKDKRNFYSAKNRLSCVYKNIECGDTKSSKKQINSQFSKRPANLQIVTKTNLIKLLNRMFVSNPDIANHLFTRAKNPYFLHSLFCQFLSPFCPQQQSSTAQQKYQSIILCDSHRLLLKTILSTLHTMLIAGSTTGHSFVMDFLRCEGIRLLENCTELDRNQGHYGRDVVNVMGALDSEGCHFYNKLNEEHFVRFVRVSVELILIFGTKYLDTLKQLGNHSSENSSISQLLQVRWCLHRQLKQTRNSLLIAYTRATEPTLFQSCIEFILYSQEHPQLLEELSSVMNASSTEEQQIKIYSSHILEICDNPKLYLQQHSSGNYYGYSDLANVSQIL